MKIPQHGDPELLPKPVIEAPTTRRMPFGPSGILLPKGPVYDVRRAAPDIKGLPWVRHDNDEWTSPEQRAVVLEYLRTFLRDTAPLFVSWRVVEKDRHGRSPTRSDAPLLIFSFVRQVDRQSFECGHAYPPYTRENLDVFRTHTVQVGPPILAIASP